MMEVSMFALALGVLQHTPWWVFALFALLVVLGIQALRPRVISLWRLLVTPTVFIGWGIFSLFLRLDVSAAPFVFDWLATALAGGALAWITLRSDAMRIEANGIARPGSILPLVRNLLIFSAKYALAVAALFNPAHRLELAFLDVAVSGASAGYFLGWVAQLALLYRRSSRDEPSLAAGEAQTK
jgi:hypothetical protein